MPPSRDSPHHILNILNDDCIQEIFRRLPNIRDFLSAAVVCTRFQVNAIRCFPKQNKSICIGELGHINSITVKNVQSFLSIFDYLIKSIQWNKTDRNQDNQIFDMIGNFCGKTLLNLMIRDHSVNFTRNFQLLEKLEIESGSIRQFHLPQQLKRLKLELVKVIDFDSFVQVIPRIEELELISVKGFTDESIIAFLDQNPQLKSLRIEDCNQVSSFILRGIGNRVPNLISLNVVFSYYLVNNEDMLHISGLQALKRLDLRNPTFSVKPLVEALVENDVSLEEFRLAGYGNEVIGSIVKLNTLTNLSIGNISEKLIITLVKELTNLEKLRVACDDITPYGLVKILEHGKHLTDLFVVVEFQMEINLDFYNLMLALAKDRIHIRLMIRTEMNSLKKIEFSHVNRKWLNISYF